MNVLDWQRAFQRPDVGVLAFDRDLLCEAPRVELRVDGWTFSARPLYGLTSKFVFYHVYVGTMADGLYVPVSSDGHPVTVADAVIRAARRLARTRCHAGAGHAPAIDRGPFGELCPPCWVAVCEFLDVDKEPLPF